MITTETIYEGSRQCRCGKILTPVEAMYSQVCPDCTAAAVKALIAGAMVPEETPLRESTY